MDWVILGVLALFVSIGTAGVPGTATIVTASVLTAAGLPLEVMVLTIPISAIADTGRTAINVTAALTSTLLVAHQEKNLDLDVYYDRAETATDKTDTAVLEVLEVTEVTEVIEGIESDDVENSKGAGGRGIAEAAQSI
jgi:Na+/H+-dicarboxylate symporter